ncbi:MAG TPA: histidinol-phosphate transaminase [Candidatus Coprenecus stercoravium]|uniref:Multifunctional fusion protein n=1 Tax=Candidatus Coprenecus stercoravium TaxID=2840735 RepID=A0A9D2GRK5_9BACT|nr:histidinol-phosphate transaminase [Candidatus Coprenecus stercoravium]
MNQRENIISLLLRDNIRKITPYSTARDDCKVKMDIYLDANENPYPNGVNRYPSPHQTKLKEMLSVLKHVPAENIFTGNGSDEAIDLIFRLFCPPGKSSMVQVVPTYGMYSVAAAINDVRVIDAPLDGNFALDAAAVLSKVEKDTKVIFLCSPNNPSGNLLDSGQILRILDGFDGIVVVDEAYIDFADGESFTMRLAEYPRLVVLQTMSKAWGMAGLRIGIAIADKFIVDMMSRIKYPYNISALNQSKAEELLSDPLAAADRVAEIKSERSRLAAALSGMDSVVKVYPSDANFLLVRFRDKTDIFDRLLQNGIIVRDRSSACGCDGCLRITVGTPEENDRVIAVISGETDGRTADGKSASADSIKTGRRASCYRKTGETAVSVRVDLDTFRKPVTATGLGFFNHMLEQIGYHGGIGLEIICFGDLSTDDHHSVEDVAIALGDCLKKALGDKSGIGRYGFCLPMDEAEAMVLLDLGGRTDFLWNVTLHEPKVGDVSSQMFRHFFKSLSEHLNCNLHIKAAGENDHHIVEGIFKAFARALKSAVKQEQQGGAIPSSKGWI